MILRQFFSSFTFKVLIAIIALHILAFIAAYVPILSVILLGVTIILLARITYSNLFFAVLIAFLEVFIGGHGSLIQYTVFDFSLSLRMAIFIGLITGFVVASIKKGFNVSFKWMRDTPFLLLAMVIISATIIGLLNGNGISAIIDDMNSYVWFLYLLPIICIDWTRKRQMLLLQTLFASMIWVAAFTLILAYLFTHLNGDALHVIYTFVRDSRLAEVTLQVTHAGGAFQTMISSLIGEGNYWYRIFMPSQLFLLPTSALLLLCAWQKGLHEKNDLYVFPVLILFLSALILSLSRSFLIGVFTACCILLVLGFFHIKKAAFNKTVFLIGGTILAGIVSIGLALLVSIAPIPVRPDITDAAFYQTSAETGRSEAVVSRWNLLDPLYEEIKQAPILGAGFGKTVSYQSTDPRIEEQTGDGIYTIYRFEWGYHDIWLKTGLIGLISYTMILIAIISGLMRNAKRSESAWFSIGLIASLCALFTIHIFSPYLNHPIGIALILFIIPFCTWKNPMGEQMKGIRNIASKIGFLKKSGCFNEKEKPTLSFLSMMRYL